MTPRAAERGISTLEALAALALIAIVTIPLLDLQINLARAGAAYETTAQRLDARRNALTALRDINPSVTPEGALALGDGLTMRWRSRALSAETRGRAYPAGDGAFLVTLYALSVSIDGSDLETAFEVERLGWRRVNDP